MGNDRAYIKKLDTPFRSVRITICGMYVSKMEAPSRSTMRPTAPPTAVSINALHYA